MPAEASGTLLSDITSEPLHWLWEKRIPLGKLTTLDGDPGLGKSLLTLDLAARVTTGRPMPDGTPGVSGTVVLIAPEDGAADTIKPRIEAADGDPSRIRLLNLVKSACPIPDNTLLSPFTFSEHLFTFVRTIIETLPVLVILDPFIAMLGPRISAYSDQKIRKTLSQLALLAAHANCAIIVVRHLNKGTSQNPLYQSSGSIGIIATVRTGFLVARHPSDENRRLLVPIKNNLSAKADTLAYQVIANADNIPTIQWLGTDHSSLTSLLSKSASLSPERQALLKILQTTDHPLGPAELAQQTGQSPAYLRQMLRRMLNAGDIISPHYGLYTIPGHLSLKNVSSHHHDATPFWL